MSSIASSWSCVTKIVVTSTAHVNVMRSVVLYELWHPMPKGSSNSSTCGSTAKVLAKATVAVAHQKAEMVAIAKALKLH